MTGEGVDGNHVEFQQSMSTYEIGGGATAVHIWRALPLVPLILMLVVKVLTVMMVHMPRHEVPVSSEQIQVISMEDDLVVVSTWLLLGENTFFFSSNELIPQLAVMILHFLTFFSEPLEF